MTGTTVLWPSLSFVVIQVFSVYLAFVFVLVSVVLIVYMSGGGEVMVIFVSSSGSTVSIHSIIALSNDVGYDNGTDVDVDVAIVGFPLPGLGCGDVVG